MFPLYPLTTLGLPRKLHGVQAVSGDPGDGGAAGWGLRPGWGPSRPVQRAAGRSGDREPAVPSPPGGQGVLYRECAHGEEGELKRYPVPTKRYPLKVSSADGKVPSTDQKVRSVVENNGFKRRNAKR